MDVVAIAEAERSKLQKVLPSAPVINQIQRRFSGKKKSHNEAFRRKEQGLPVWGAC